MKYCHTCGLCANKFFRPFFVAVDGVVVVDAAVVVVAVTTFHSSHSQVPFINTLILMNICRATEARTFVVAAVVAVSRNGEDVASDFCPSLIW